MPSQAAPGKRRQKQDPLTKRFTNGHKCFTAMQSKFMIEIMTKDEGQRLGFEDNKYVLKPHRNPVNGELTARDSAPYLVQFDSATLAMNATKGEQSESANTNTLIKRIVDNSHLQGSTQAVKVVSEVNRCENLRTRRDLLEQEVEMVNKVLEHKRVCAQGGFTGTGQAKVKYGKTATRRPF